MDPTSPTVDAAAGAELGAAAAVREAGLIGDVDVGDAGSVAGQDAEASEAAAPLGSPAAADTTPLPPNDAAAASTPTPTPTPTPDAWTQHVSVAPAAPFSLSALAPGAVSIVGALVLVVLGVAVWQLVRASRQIREAGVAAGERMEQKLREELRAHRVEAAQTARELRTEVTSGLHASTELMVGTVSEMGKAQGVGLQAVTKQLETLTEANETRIERLRKTIDHQLASLQEGNEKKLEAMRLTVDETLQSTLEKRLGESFKLVGDRLEAVQKGLGEMRSLASGVGDLKRVLTNVKTRGSWGEVQLEAILEQVLTPDQFSRNVKTRPDSREHVEFAIRLPGRGDTYGERADEQPGDERRARAEGCVWLPIDSKFPQEDYQRLSEAADNGDREAVDLASAALGRAVVASAKDISAKYVNPPYTTDFALLFLPTEGLYAEVLRRPGLLEQLQHEHRVVIAGPTTLAAILSSLRLGFRTLAIEQRASEVWQTLAAVKTEFGKFGTVLDKVKRQLDAASNTIEKTGVRTRAIQKKLRDVESLPADEVAGVLGEDLVLIGEGPEEEEGDRDEA